MRCRTAFLNAWWMTRRRIPALLIACLSLLILARPVDAQDGVESSLFGRAYPRVNVSGGYAVDPSWPHGDCRDSWGAMSGITVDRQGRIWTLNRGEVPVQVFDREGTPLTSWGEGAFSKPHQIRIGPDESIWIADAGLHVVRKYTPEGRLLMTLGTPGEAGEDSVHLDGPTDMAITPEGEIFVSDGYGNNRVVRYDPAGRYVGSWGRLGSGPGEFSLPHAIALDSRGRLYVADRNNARVQVFDQGGRHLDEWRDLLVPWNLWITDQDEVHVCGSSPMRWPGRLPLPGLVLGVPPKDQLVMRFDPDGRLRSLWTFPMPDGAEARPGELNWVHAIAVDGAGDLYLGDIQGRRAQRFERLSGEARATRGELVDQGGTRDEAVRKAASP